VVGALAALHQRHATGKGRHIRSGLFETNLLLVAQFIAQFQLTGTAPKPMGAERKPPWGVYDIFETADGGRVFVAVVGDAQWQTFAREFLPPAWAADPRLRTAMDRETARPWLVPGVAAVLKGWNQADLCAALENFGLSFGPIRQPHELLQDPHLTLGGALLPTTLADGRELSTAALPIEFDGLKSGLRNAPPRIGADTDTILRGLGLDDARIAAMRAAGVIAD
jgi:crotonobetainyl-CoA:carnitine CoA-transferase CaiB-like acyl-CoA transferase